MFKKIKRIIFQYLLIIITLLVFTSMIFITSYLRAEYSKKPTVFSIVSETPGAATVSMINMATQMDANSSRSLYRKIWTYDAIIFLCGALLIYSIKHRNEG
ncbi:MAG: hypothetical protein WCW61_02670 [Patescibacteria group bacterium]|jgi:uncharacterized membrane protein AbrB (regulator of aidB expression)